VTGSPSVDLILPARAPAPVRRAALERALAGARAAGLGAVVAEQAPARGAGCPELAALAGRAGARHEVVASGRPLLERARLVNAAAAGSAADWLWVHDPRLELPFAEVAAALAEPTVRDAAAVRPFGALAGVERAPALGRLSYLVPRDVFLAVGGLHEAFVGPADEGLELIRRVRRLFPGTARSLDAVTGRLGPRPGGPGEAELRRRNKGLRERLTARLEADPARYLREELGCDPARVEALRARREVAAAFAVTRPTPPPRRPARLPGALWGLTTFFNPAGYATKRANYARFRAGLRPEGLPLLTVELAFGERPFELGPDDAEVLVQARGGDPLWQKERLLNVGLGRLPPECDKVVWLDADVLFARRGWAAETARRLEDHVVVQPYSRSVRLRAGETEAPPGPLPLGAAEHQVLHGIAWGVGAKGPDVLDRYLAHGHSGYAWAGRRAVLARHGLYDANVLGNGDLNMAHAMFGGPDRLKEERLSPAAAAHLGRWAAAFHADVRGSVGWVEGTVLHLWHGDKADRLYDRRLTVLEEHAFDPETDLAVAPSGAYRWASDKPGLQAWCADYFRRRREDGG